MTACRSPEMPHPPAETFHQWYARIAEASNELPRRHPRIDPLKPSETESAAACGAKISEQSAG
jgi:hypothetical protein